MSSWTERKKKIKSELDFDPLITIPMMEDKNIKREVIQKRIREVFDKEQCSNITIVDPYFLAQDLEFIVLTFASIAGRKIRIITKLEDHQNGVKKAHEESFEAVIVDIEKKGIFSGLSVYKTNVPLHDRYLISDNINESSPCFSLGTSINMIFKRHTCLLKLDNNSFKRQVLRLINKCILDGTKIRGSYNGQ